MDGFDGLLLLSKGTANRDILREAIVGGRIWELSIDGRRNHKKYSITWCLCNPMTPITREFYSGDSDTPHPCLSSLSLLFLSSSQQPLKSLLKLVVHIVV